MDLILAFVVFLAHILICLVTGWSLILAMCVGFLCFMAVGLHRGFSLTELMCMAGRGSKSALVVVRIMVLVGMLTALWRASGTIAYFVQRGVGLITPRSFLLMAFLLPALMSLAFGSSFGVAGTAGVILMTIARSGSAHMAITAGAVMSGAFIGERLSPASSAAALTAAVTGTDQRKLQEGMWRTSWLPLLLCLALYSGLSVIHPISAVNTRILADMEAGFCLTWPAIAPAAALLLCAMLKIDTWLSIAASCLTAAVVAVMVQEVPLEQLPKICMLGYTPQRQALSELLSGGGICSMLSVLAIICLSCANCGIFNGTGMLDSVSSWAGRLVGRVGLFGTHVTLSLCCCGLFCNQSVSIVMSANLTESYYREHKLPPLLMGVNVGDSSINLSALVPWSIMCGTVLSTIGGTLGALPFAFYLYLVPVCRGIQKYDCFPEKEIK